MNLQYERMQFLCETLNLPFVAQGYASAAQTAAEQGTAYSDFLESLLKTEAAGRQVRKQSMLTRLAGFPAIKTLEDFDYPDLDAEDQEAVRQRAIAALNLTQQAKQLVADGDRNEPTANTALIDGVRKFAMDVRELDIDLIDRINPFGEAYASVSMRSTVAHRSTAKTATSLSGFTPCGLTACERSRIAAPC